MSLTPVEIANAYPAIGKKKAATPSAQVLFRAMFAGACVALATVCAHSVSTLLPHAGTAKLVAALLFPTGLGMILLIGGELFTGNCMVILSVWAKKVSVPALLKNWGIVYAGNFIGSVLIAAISIAARRGDEAFLTAAIYAADAKAALSFGDAFLRGILCNILVCGAVWMSYATQSSTGKIIAMYFPVALFVICGTEHCVANMYYFSAALFAGGAIPMANILNNLAAATLGNIVGGALIFSGCVYMCFPRGEAH